MSPRHWGTLKDPRPGHSSTRPKFSQPHTEGLMRTILFPPLSAALGHGESDSHPCPCATAPAPGPTPEPRPQPSQPAGQCRDHGPCLRWSSVSPSLKQIKGKGAVLGHLERAAGAGGSGGLRIGSGSGSFCSYPGTGDRQEGRGLAAQGCGDGREACLVPKQAPRMSGW